jgi:flagellar biosynthesis protein FlhA
MADPVAGRAGRLFRTLLTMSRGNASDMVVAVFVVVIVAMLIIPLPPVLLDLLMTVNIVLSLLTILIVLYTRHALEFSVFPTLLLISTIFGLALNVSSTRLILSQGSRFGGRIVRAFGTFVVGAKGAEGYVIGIIIFAIIVVVQFIVITKGSTRVAEVAARFTLDALPGKQMAIEGEYNSGLITEEEARRRKTEVQREVDFYGAMDGASKFISGNVKVGLLITVINIVGGFLVGMLIHGEGIDVALDTYIPLTIGDGLVTQLPSLLVSTATGIIVTRAASDRTFGQDVTAQFGNQSRPYLIAAGLLLVLSVLPGFPFYVLIPLAILVGFLGVTLYRRKQAAAEVKPQAGAREEGQAQPEATRLAPLDPLSLELGYGLIPLVDKEHGAELLDRITRIRRDAALDLGLVVPPIRIIDNMRLEPSEYCFKIRGVEVGRGRIRPSMYLAINSGRVTEEITGEPTRDPTFGLPAIWIAEELRDRAEGVGYTVVDPSSIIATHLQEIIRRHAAEVLGRQETQSILDALKPDYPAVLEDLQKSEVTVGQVQKVLQGLLGEQVSIRNIVAILETIADYAGITKDVGFLVEKARQSLGRQLCLQYADDKKVLRVLTLEPSLERRIIDSKAETARGTIAALEPEIHRKWMTALSNSVRSVQEQGHTAILLCSEAARALVRSSTVREIPHLVVLSAAEMVSEVNLESLGQVSLGEPPEEPPAGGLGRRRGTATGGRPVAAGRGLAAAGAARPSSTRGAVLDGTRPRR